jgi:hypothetical protein
VIGRTIRAPIARENLGTGVPATLLEKLCAHALSIAADLIKVEYKDGREWVYAGKGVAGFGIADFRSSSEEARELRTNLHAAARRPVRTVAGGRRWMLHVRVFDSFGDDAFEVKITPAPQVDPASPPAFTAKQGQYLAFIHYYSKIHRRAPAESDLQRYFQVSAPSVHGMIVTLERNGLIERTPGEARSIRLMVAPEHLPPLE